jgi:hypothetical protein
MEDTRSHEVARSLRRRVSNFEHQVMGRASSRCSRELAKEANANACHCVTLSDLELWRDLHAEALTCFVGYYAYSTSLLTGQMAERSKAPD